MASAQNEMIITRVFNAPRERVWEAWTNPEVLMKWWGPKRYTTPVSKIDLRVGGAYLSCMRSPGGKDYWSTGVYREIVKPERLVMTDSFADEKGRVMPASYYGMKGEWQMELLIQVAFEVQDGKTKLTLRHIGLPADMNAEMAKAGWMESFDKLDELLEKGEVTMPKTELIAEPGELSATVRRIYNAPPGRLFKAYTDSEMMIQWWGPKYLTSTVEKMDVKPGGIWRIVQRDQKDTVYGFHGVYHEVSPPARLVQTFEYEGAPGHVSLEVVTFEDVGGKTRVTDKTIFESFEDRDAMIKSGMEKEVEGIYDRLAELVEK